MDSVTRLIHELRPAVGDERVLEAISKVPRECFIPADKRHRAYENCALPIACGQTISQPLVVARMLELLALGPGDRVLDIGTGSGYHAALLSRLAARVLTVERQPELAEQARRTLAELRVGNVELYIGDGALGLPGHGPFDAINVAAALPREVPPALEQQLVIGGRLIAPVGESHQRLVLVRRTTAGFRRTELEPVRFVPLVPDGPG